jgi:hypothetical protein
VPPCLACWGQVFWVESGFLALVRFWIKNHGTYPSVALIGSGQVKFFSDGVGLDGA